MDGQLIPGNKIFLCFGESYSKPKPSQLYLIFAIKSGNNSGYKKLVCQNFSGGEIQRLNN